MPATAWFETDADCSTEVVIAGSGDETGGPSSDSMGAAPDAPQVRGPQTQRHLKSPTREPFGFHQDSSAHKHEMHGDLHNT